MPERQRHAKIANEMAVATGIITVGTFIPAAQYIYGILPATTDIALAIA